MEMASVPGVSPANKGTANIRYSVYNQPGNYVGKSVSEVRSQLTKLWGVPTDAVGHLGKEKLSDDYVIQDGDNIEFHKRSGEKG